MALSFSTKAVTLDLLKDVLQTARVAPLAYFTHAEWNDDRSACLARVQAMGSAPPYIVRSSAQCEDSLTKSNAGAFLTLTDIPAGGLEKAVSEVFASYGEPTDKDQVLVQSMLQNVVRSGVAFSHDPNAYSPYRVINWSEGGNTSAITSGVGGRTWHMAANAPIKPPEALSGLILLLEELLVLFGGVPVDCEFGVTMEDGGEILWLLQARPLIMRSIAESNETQATRLRIIHEKVSRAMLPHPFLKGRRTVYGVMPDWNPAEMIGVRPKPLALSLYRELLTDAIWAYQRHNYGYRNLRSFPLMPHFFGQPYIDVRLSFNSFIPADLSDNLAGRLTDFYIDRLISEPTLHDKVEFEIVFSCYTLDLPERITRLKDAGFSSEECDEIADSLRRLTNRIVHPKEGLWRGDLAKIDVLTARREELLTSPTGIIERIYWLLEDAKRYGTLPFAGLARAGFIAVQILKSLVAVNVFSPDDYDNFFGSVSTISGQLARDRAALDRTTFLQRYGHLRPGTYDVLSPRYDEAPDFYFDWNLKVPSSETGRPFSLTLPQMRELARLLDAHGLHPDPVGLLDFLQAGIELRELAKFHFTRNLSDAMSLIVEFGERNGFSKEEMAYSDISVFRELHVGAADPREMLRVSIEQGKTRHEETLKLVLPSLIVSPDNVWGFEWTAADPNFITQKQVAAPVTSCDAKERLAGSIVCIPNADPGFDWLFAYPIAGLITAWGGTNSHMAIRAGELSLPAVIGAGEMLYKQWSNARKLHLDCAGRRVEVLE